MRSRRRSLSLRATSAYVGAVGFHGSFKQKEVGIVGVDDSDDAFLVLGEFANTFQTLEAESPVVLEDVRVELEKKGAPGIFRFQLRVVEESVTRMEEPAGAVFDGNAAVATGVTREGHEEDFGIEAGNWADGVEAQPPLIRIDLVEAPSRLVAELARAIALMFNPLLRMQGGFVFGLKHVDRGTWEIGEAARLIEIEVGEDDIADVLGFESQKLELPDHRLVDVKLGLPPRLPEGAGKRLHRLGDVMGAESGIDEDDSGRGFDGEAVANELSTREGASMAVDEELAAGTEGAAIEVVNAHGRSYSS